MEENKELTLDEALKALDEAYDETMQSLEEFHQKKINLILQYKKKEDEAKLAQARSNLAL